MPKAELDAAAAERYAEVEAMQELDRRECAADCCVFMERHVSIETVSGRSFRLRLWPFQRATVRAVHNERRVIVLKARRLGLSWVALAYVLWVAIFQQGTRILILCKNEDDAAELLDRIRRMRDRMLIDPLSMHLVGDLREGPKVRDTQTTLDLGASRIRALPAKARAARLETAAVVVLDEFAFAAESAEIWRAILPTTEQGDESGLEFVDDRPPVLEGDGRLVVISTGNGSSEAPGAGQEFAKQWSSAASGESGFVPLFWPWDSRPDRDQSWHAAQLAAMGDERRFRIEYPEKPGDAFLSADTEHVYDPAGIDAAERMGRDMDAQRAAGTLPPPAGGGVRLGVDWGERTVGLVVYPLELGGLYVTDEVATTSAVPSDVAHALLDVAARHAHPTTRASFDAAGVQSMRQFMAVARERGLCGGVEGSRLRWESVPFGKYKAETIGYIRWLLARSAAGEATRVLAISPSCRTLLRQLRALEFADADAGKVLKVDDHGPDALIAGAASTAATHRATVQKAQEAKAA